MTKRTNEGSVGGQVRESGRADNCSEQDSNQAAMSDVVIRTGLRIRGSGTVLKEIKNVYTHQCTKCGNRYRHKKWFECHVKKCRRPAKNG